jgi:hypothetical protein
VEGEQGGEQRAEYGKQVLPALAKRLTAEFGKGFSASSLWNYRQFYLDFLGEAIEREGLAQGPQVPASEKAATST